MISRRNVDGRKTSWIPGSAVRIDFTQLVDEIRKHGIKFNY